MRKDDVSEGLRALAFEFFFKFSRLEYALKAAGYLKSHAIGANAQADWQQYARDLADRYTLSPAGQRLISEAPQRQIVGNTGLAFRKENFDPGTSDLQKVVRFANTVRNNLFHGGKHGDDYWDDPDRMAKLLELTIATIDDLAEQTGLSSDYRRYY